MKGKALLRATTALGLACAIEAGAVPQARAADQPWWLMNAALPGGPAHKPLRRKAVPAEAEPGEAGVPTQQQAQQQAQEQARAADPPASVADDRPGVLTREGVLVVEPSIEYQHTDVNKFIVGGVAILDTVLVGSVEATQANRDSVTGTLGLRYGITNRFEAELRIPYMYRNDSTTNTVVNSNNTQVKTDLSDHGLGDIEGALHYQVNDGDGGWPFFVANIRVKSTTGKGPYDTERDPATGIERELATGSGFWGVEPSLTVVAPSDPAVFYANVGYLWNVAEDKNEVVANNRTVTHVDPGDAIRLGVGMGISLNERVSFSLGYQHDYIMKTRTTFAEAGDFDSETLNVGSLNIGVNWQATPDTAVSFNLGIGVTKDAPDVRLVVRMPISVKLF